MTDPLEIGNVGTVPEKLKQAHVVISAEQESQGYQGDQQIQGKRKYQNSITVKEELAQLNVMSKIGGYS